MRFTLRFLTFSLIALVLITTLTAVAATNTVPPTRVENQVISFQINHLRPSACAGLSLTTLVTGSGTLTGTAGNDLILGGTGIDIINGAGGNDCILGGGGADVITGDAGSDVCLGGAGIDNFITCEGQVQ
jgi:Ca2+-binding RTX toxin-like protein